MINKFSTIIFTDLDGSLIHRDNFTFDQIKDYVKYLIYKGINIIPNTSKTDVEVENFNKELGLNLPYISENGSAIHGLENINKNFPNKIILSREKEKILETFKKRVPNNLRSKCEFIEKMEGKIQQEIFGLSNRKLKDVFKRSYSTPILFRGNNDQKKDLYRIVKNAGLSLHEGGRVINICDNVNKVRAMNKVVKILKKTDEKIKTIAVGDNYNDLDMLKNSDVPCLVFNDQFKLDQINIDNLIFSNQPSPEGWADVIKKALAKLNYNV